MIRVLTILILKKFNFFKIKFCNVNTYLIRNLKSLRDIAHQEETFSAISPVQNNTNPNGQWTLKACRDLKG